MFLKFIRTAAKGAAQYRHIVDHFYCRLMTRYGNAAFKTILNFSFTGTHAAQYRHMVTICLYCAVPLAAVRINFKNIRRTNKLNIALLRMCSTNAVRIANECWDAGAVRIATSVY